MVICCLFREQCLLPLDEFVSLRQLFSQDLSFFSHSEQFFFDRHALTLLTLLPFGKSELLLRIYHGILLPSCCGEAIVQQQAAHHTMLSRLEQTRTERYKMSVVSDTFRH